MSEEQRDVQISTTDNGPYLVRGNVNLVDSEGNEYEVDKQTVALCRCGASTSKPFCDGTHSEVGFEAANRAVREQEEQAAQEESAEA